MSISGKDRSSNMGTPFFHEFKKQASFFLKEKIKTARLALTDVTLAELWTEEATNGNPWAPDTPTLRSISKAAFELDDYWRIMEILHRRLVKFERKNWRVSYNSLAVLEHLLTHGPESVAEEFQSEKDVISQMGSFQYIDEKGFNWGLTVNKKSERILKLLGKGPLLKEERDTARKLTRGIQGFGSFCQRTSSAQGILKESSSFTAYNDHKNEENQLSYTINGVKSEAERLPSYQYPAFISTDKIEIENHQNQNGFKNDQMLEKPGTSLKENVAPKKEELHHWSSTTESNPLLNGNRNEPLIVIPMEGDHPFTEIDNKANTSLLSAREGILQGC
ncbi:ENTH/VHS family protein [Quillaja saponaria]|uniref:ENTH/VHS family protein n=1 Tax=Quillaja saponaria TaxID=32244 RepID=A0AAD7PAF6_QUISA|nr:ENTH/VHS family protein [Quillaja saponaria]